MNPTDSTFKVYARNKMTRKAALLSMISMVGITLAACGGGGGTTPPAMGATTPPAVGTTTPPPVINVTIPPIMGATTPPVMGVTPPLVASSIYIIKNLVSDGISGTPNTDVNLVNGWGIAFGSGPAWITANATSKSTLYDGNGLAKSLVVSIPAGRSGAANPTGIVYNNTQDFKVTQGSATGASPFIFVGEAGTLSGWSSSVNGTSAVTVYDGYATKTIYKGLAIANNVSNNIPSGSYSSPGYGSASSAGTNYLYATDFHNGKVDVFDGSFNQTVLPGSFKDPSLPAGYAPYGIYAISGQIYVAYAKQDATASNEIKGAGLGIVNLFDTSGNFVKRLVTSGALNAPWGLALAPANFGKFSNSLLVGNFGDGLINAYDPVTGSMIGTLAGADGKPLVIDGLWGIAFGNGVSNQPVTTLFYTAGPSNETHGVFGRLDLQ